MALVGIDLEEIGRIMRCMENPRFCKRILGPEEYEQLARRKFPAQSVTASFCAKEAFSKAVGTGISGFSLGEVELLRAENGRPFLSLHGRALALAQKTGCVFSVSVTHAGSYTAAVVVGETPAP